MSFNKTVIVMVGQSGMGKTTAINTFAQQELGKTGLYESQTQAMREYSCTKGSKEYYFLDTIGLHDNTNLEEFSDEQILRKLEIKLGHYPKETRIVFVLV